jgi:hypothetical protein
VYFKDTNILVLLSRVLPNGHHDLAIVFLEMNKSIFVFIFFMSLRFGFSQEENPDVTVNRQFWTDFNGRREFKENKSASGFIGYRTISPHVYDKFVAFGTYDINHTKSPEFLNLKKPLINSFHLGGGLYYTDNKNDDNVFEFRLSEGFKFYIPSIKELPLMNFVRLEQRFQTQFGGTWNTSMRFRYKISTVIEWKKRLFSFNKGMYIPINVEFFYSFSEADRDNDVIRISPGLGYKFSDEWKAEFYISYHYTRNTTDDQDASNDFVFRLRIYKSKRIKKPPKLNTKEEDVKDLIE